MNPQLTQFALGNVREVDVEEHAGQPDIYGVVVTPHDFQPGHARPTIVELHGGPTGWWWSGWLGTYLSRGQYFASHGFVTFLPNALANSCWTVRAPLARRHRNLA